MANEKIGPTGEYPQGKLNADDNGELRMSLVADKETNHIFLEFGVPVEWLGLTPTKAMQFSDKLIELVDELADHTSVEAGEKTYAQRIKEELKPYNIPMYHPAIVAAIQRVNRAVKGQGPDADEYGPSVQLQERVLELEAFVEDVRQYVEAMNWHTEGATVRRFAELEESLKKLST